MVLNWLDPVLTTFKHRGTLLDFLSGGFTKLLGKKIRLAFTGMEGVGKSVLLDQLTGKALQPGYKRPQRSQGMESGTVKPSTRKILVSVIPGQNAHPRHLALEELFKGTGPVDGVVHVVGGGFASVRSPDAAQALIKDYKINTIAKYRDYQRERELEDLRETCEAIRTSHRKHHAPKWLIVAVDKVDLYHDNLEKWRRHYSADGDSVFTARLQELTRQVGTDNFRWEAVPVCGCLETFEWNKKQVTSQIPDDRRQAYVAQFLQFLESYCAP